MFTDERWIGKMQAASAEIDARFGEAFFLCPTERRPNYGVEPAGTAIAITAVFSYRSATIFGRDDTAKRQGGATVESRKPILTFAKSQATFVVKAGDVATRCCDGTQWEVTKVAPDGVSRITLDLVERGVQRQ